MSTILPARTIDYPNFSTETVVLVPTDGGAHLVVCRQQWITALPLAALHGWEISDRGPNGPRYLFGFGETMSAETTAAIGAGLRQAVAALVQGETNPDQILETRYTVLDLQPKSSPTATRYTLAPYAELARVVRQTGPAGAAQHPAFVALLQLSDALVEIGEVILASELPVGWLNPRTPASRVVVLAHPSGAGCCFQVAGAARAAGEVVTIATTEAEYLELQGTVRRLTQDEADALDGKVKEAPAKPAKRSLGKRLRDVVAG